MVFSTGFSNHGDTLDVVAPGEDVWTLNRSGAIRTSGTSVAAPYVTGAAGLLLSFDPRLANRGDSLKRLLVDGATRGSRRVLNGVGPDSIAVLHAYEALKLVAARRGAPLCGNRLWTESRRINVQRGTGTETLVDLGGGISRDDIDVLHGGRRMRVNYTGQFGRDSTLTYVLENNAWRQQGSGAIGWTIAVPGSSGTYLGTRWRSHGGDSVLTVLESDEYGWATLDLTLSWPGGSRRLPQLRRPQTADGDHSLCIIRIPPSPTQSPADSVGGCVSSILYGGWAEYGGWEVVYSPAGTEIIVLSRLHRGTSSVTAWSTCPWTVTTGTPRRECRSLVSTGQYAPSELRSVNIASGAERTLFTFDGYAHRIAVDESGSELMLQRQTTVTRNTYGPGTRYMEYLWTNPPPDRTCAIEIRNVRTGALKSTMAGVNCVASDHGISISPVRMRP